MHDLGHRHESYDHSHPGPDYKQLETSTAFPKSTVPDMANNCWHGENRQVVVNKHMGAKFPFRRVTIRTQSHEYRGPNLHRFRRVSYI